MHNFLSDEVRTSWPLLVQTDDTSTGTLSSEIDMAGYDGLRLTAPITNTTAAATVTLQAWGSTASSGTFALLSGTSAVGGTTGLANKFLQLDLWKPTFRYIKGRLVRAAANSAAAGIIADQYAPRSLPATNDTGTAGATVVKVASAAT